MKIKWGNILGIVIVIIVLINMRAIVQSFRSIHQWFAESFAGLNNFSEGAQTAIAFCSILLVVVMVYRLIQK